MSTETDTSGTGGAVSAPTRERPVREGRLFQRRREDEFSSERHVYEPHTAGLPPLRSYARELWRRREFAMELSRTRLRAQHFNTFFGQLWLLLNPLLLAAVYFVLVDILRQGTRGEDFFAHLMAGLFAYYFVSNAMREGVRSVVKGGRLILNTAFPRALLPLSSVLNAFLRFLPTIFIYAPVHVISGLPVGPQLLWLVPLTALLAILASGLSMFVAAAQVYFRDLAGFLPYALRVWLYASPILYYADEVPDRYDFILAANPLAPLLTAWSDVLGEGHAPSLESLAIGSAWAFGVFALGALFFISREREFAVRL
jgi:teichoic acid transport system permease protein